MSLILTVLVFVTLLQCMCICYSHDDVRHFTKEFVFDQGGPVVNHTVVIPNDFDGFTYVTNHLNTSGSRPNVKFTISMETYPFPNGTIKSSCHHMSVDFGQKSDRDPVYVIKWLSLTKTKILMYTLDFFSNESFDRLRMDIIDMVSCSSTNFSLPVPKLNESSIMAFVSSPIIYNTSFDIVLFSKYACFDYEICWLSFDFEGRQIGKPKSFRSISAPYYIIPKSVLSPSKGFYTHWPFVSWPDKKLKQFPRFSYINPTGDIKELTDSRNKNLGFSVAHELLSVCQRLDLVKKDSDEQGQELTKMYQMLTV